MRLTEYLILEARKNPTLNAKVDTIEQLRAIATKYPSAFVTFTQINKFGANPSSDYNTPLGIYAYPINFLLGQAKEESDSLRSVFGSHQPYIQAFTVNPNANIWILSDTEMNLSIKQLLIKSLHVLGYDYNKLFRLGDYETDRDLWYTMYQTIKPGFDPETEDNTGDIGTATRKVLRKAGIDGVVDPKYGIIHENEPTQAVFFNIKQLNHIATLNNKLLQNAKTKSEQKILQHPEEIQDIGDFYYIMNNVFSVASPARKKQLIPVLTKIALNIIKQQYNGVVPTFNFARAIAQLIIASSNPKFEGPLWDMIEQQYREKPRQLIPLAQVIDCRIPKHIEDILIKFYSGINDASWEMYKSQFNLPEQPKTENTHKRYYT
jgi:hypothetical protein